ncbi:hypothetical protein ACFVUS_12720 [Nocardia sp. NPDC058058]|uniref:hypothetical protein n=1 Tax=Nocardia sp. NPDC058058 TaxID=3346317 RepID=UPI0036DD2ABE
MKREEIPPDMQGRVKSLLRTYLTAVLVAGAQFAEPDGLFPVDSFSARAELFADVLAVDDGEPHSSEAPRETA